MGLYKKCDCGTKNTFLNRGAAPRKCKECGRSLIECSTLDDEIREDYYENQENDNVKITTDKGFYFSLETMDGKKQIIIPYEGGFVGRNALGSDVFENNCAISREHIRVNYKGRIGIVIEDNSKYGTYLNNEQLIKGTSKFAREGDVVKLYDFELIVRKKEVNKICN